MRPLFAAAVACTCATGLLAGCTTAGTPGLHEAWSIQTGNSTSIVGTDDERVYLAVSRDFGTEILALRLRDGSFAWNEIAAPSASVTIVGDTVFTLQKLGEATVISAFDAEEGDALWKKSFAEPPAVALRDGTFLVVNTDRSVSTADLAGVHAAPRWIPHDGCRVVEAAADPTSENYFVITGCEDSTDELVTLSTQLRELSAEPMPKSDYPQWEATERGEFLVLQSSSSVATAVIAGGRIIYAEADLHGATFSASGDDLLTSPYDGEPPFAINTDGRLVVPSDVHRFFVASDSLTGFSATEFIVSDPRTLETLRSIVKAGTYSSASLRSEDAMVQVSLDSLGTVRRVDLRRDSRSSVADALNFADSISLATPDGDFRATREPASDAGSSSAQFKLTHEDAEYTVLVVRASTLEDAQAIWDFQFKSEDDPAQFADLNWAVNSGTIRVRDDRCLAYAYAANGNTVSEQTSLPDGLIRLLVPEGCDA